MKTQLTERSDVSCLSEFDPPPLFVRVMGFIELGCSGVISFAHIKRIVQQHLLLAGRSFKGILMDLGWSSAQLTQSGRGFTFLQEEPLDMRYDPTATLRASDIVNTWSEENIASTLKEYSQERFAWRIAHGITQARRDKPFKTNLQLVEVIRNATPRWYHERAIHPATKTFQSLRIAVNGELEALKEGLAGGLEIILSEGIIAVISFHSLEDRIVKLFFRQWYKEGRGMILTKKPVAPGKEEISANPRARSAKLRIFQKHEVL